MMVIDTYKEKDKLPRESKLAKAYKEGNYQSSLDALLNDKGNKRLNLFKTK